MGLEPVRSYSEKLITEGGVIKRIRAIVRMCYGLLVGRLLLIGVAIKTY